MSQYFSWVGAGLVFAFLVFLLHSFVMLPLSAGVAKTPAKWGVIVAQQISQWIS